MDREVTATPILGDGPSTPGSTTTPRSPGFKASGRNASGNPAGARKNISPLLQPHDGANLSFSGSRDPKRTMSIGAIAATSPKAFSRKSVVSVIKSLDDDGRGLTPEAIAKAIVRLKDAEKANRRMKKLMIGGFFAMTVLIAVSMTSSAWGSWYMKDQVVKDESSGVLTTYADVPVKTELSSSYANLLDLPLLSNEDLGSLDSVSVRSASSSSHFKVSGYTVDHNQNLVLHTQSTLRVEISHLKQSAHLFDPTNGFRTPLLLGSPAASQRRLLGAQAATAGSLGCNQRGACLYSKEQMASLHDLSRERGPARSLLADGAPSHGTMSTTGQPDDGPPVVDSVDDLADLTGVLMGMGKLGQDITMKFMRNETDGPLLVSSEVSGVVYLVDTSTGNVYSFSLGADYGKLVGCKTGGDGDGAAKASLLESMMNDNSFTLDQFARQPAHVGFMPKVPTVNACFLAAREVYLEKTANAPTPATPRTTPESGPGRRLVQDAQNDQNQQPMSKQHARMNSMLRFVEEHHADPERRHLLAWDESTTPGRKLLTNVAGFSTVEMAKLSNQVYYDGYNAISIHACANINIDDWQCQAEDAMFVEGVGKTLKTQVYTKGDACAIVFRGTTEIVDMFWNFLFLVTDPVIWVNNIWAHPGFVAGMKYVTATQNSLAHWVMNQVNLRKCTAGIVYTGHSLGGAMATLAHTMHEEFNFADLPVQKVHLVTFGAPKVFKKDPPRRIEANYRLFHDWDPIASNGGGTLWNYVHPYGGKRIRCAATHVSGAACMEVCNSENSNQFGSTFDWFWGDPICVCDDWSSKCSNWVIEDAWTHGSSVVNDMDGLWDMAGAVHYHALQIYQDPTNANNPGYHSWSGDASNYDSAHRPF